MHAQIIHADQIARPKERADLPTPVLQIFFGAHTARDDSPAEFCRFALPINLVPALGRDCNAKLLQ
jgi:hypothetical protein